MKDIIEHLSVEQIESLYEKTFGNPIDHYPSMDVSQMIDEIAEEHLSRNLFLKEASTQDLRNELELRGYQTNNLWCIDDVLNYELEDGSTPTLSENDARWVLDKVLSSEWLTEQVFVSIGEHIELLR